MPTFKVTLAYDGSGAIGWQRQATGTSIQSLIEDALYQFDGEQVTVTASGRTDAGVHALGQVVHFSLCRAIDPRTLVRALNAKLPPMVRVMEAGEVPSTFHARFDARAKTYRYRVWNAEVLSPFERGYVWHVPEPVLDGAAMSRASALLEGRHDFAAFQGSGSETLETERTVFSSRVLTRSVETVQIRSDAAFPTLPLIVYEIRGDGFLRHMVRNIVGSLVEVGRGRYAPEWIQEVLMSRARATAGPTAPSEGLFLVNVEYDEPL